MGPARLTDMPRLRSEGSSVFERIELVLPPGLPIEGARPRAGSTVTGPLSWICISGKAVGGTLRFFDDNGRLC